MNFTQNSIEFWGKMELYISQLDRYRGNGTSPGTTISRTLVRWSEVILPLISRRFVSILHSKAFDNIVDGFANHLQQPDILVHKKSKMYLLSYVIEIITIIPFVSYAIENGYVEPISLV